MPIVEPLQQVVRAQSPQPEMSHFAGDIGMTGHQLARRAVVPLRVNECKFRMIPPADAFSLGVKSQTAPLGSPSTRTTELLGRPSRVVNETKRAPS